MRFADDFGQCLNFGATLYMQFRDQNQVHGITHDIHRPKSCFEHLLIVEQTWLVVERADSKCGVEVALL